MPSRTDFYQNKNQPASDYIRNKATLPATSRAATCVASSPGASSPEKTHATASRLDSISLAMGDENSHQAILTRGLSGSGSISDSLSQYSLSSCAAFCKRLMLLSVSTALVARVRLDNLNRVSLDNSSMVVSSRSFSFSKIRTISPCLWRWRKW